VYFSIRYCVLKLPCITLPGVGPALEQKLAKCGINTIGDLLFHLPFRYQDKTRVTQVRDIRPNTWCVVLGEIVKSEFNYNKRSMFNCYINDNSGLLKIRFFHFNKLQSKRFEIGKKLRVFGEVKQYANQFEMIHPEYFFVEEEVPTLEESLSPIYSSTAGLHQNKIAQLIKIVFKDYANEINNLEWLSKVDLEKFKYPSLAQALADLHYPSPDTPLDNLEEQRSPAITRLAFDELLAQRLSLQFARNQRQSCRAPKLAIHNEFNQAFMEVLPFKLTSAQLKVSQAVAQDLTLSTPMCRLVQGDVGSGKTVIAALAAVQAAKNGYQVALMAPTEILSEQHFNTLTKWLYSLNITVSLISGKMKSSEKKKVLVDLENGTTQVIVGTHALFQDKVNFAKLGLIIIDEQHRFGVDQRLLLQKKGHTGLNNSPHQLLMTATPIPRTLTMTHLAHLDISIIDELPPGRTPVITAVLNQMKRQEIIQRLKEVLASGKQAYWVCTLIEESEKLQCIAATSTAEDLRAQLSDFRVGLIHGRLKPQEKEEIMLAFKAGLIDLLVATTVIEVGVDVPNASLMIIENAERLGLSQLHQLRGRVGRGATQAHCLLLYQAPLSPIGSERLKIMRATTDGFIIAEKDLQLRGSGEMLGTKQTGYKEFKIAKFPRDEELLELVKIQSAKLWEQDPQAAAEIAMRWEGEVKYYLQA
jgi:ATP-dependent DNA helicase RecG